MGVAPRWPVAESSGILAPGMNGFLNKIGNVSVDFLQIDTTRIDASENRSYFFGTNDPSVYTNSPYTAGAFYGYRTVAIGTMSNGTTPHLFAVTIHELYPVPGRIYTNCYDINQKAWFSGWKTLTPT